MISRNFFILNATFSITETRKKNFVLLYPIRVPQGRRQGPIQHDITTWRRPI